MQKPREKNPGLKNLGRKKGWRLLQQSVVLQKKSPSKKEVGGGRLGLEEPKDPFARKRGESTPGGGTNSRKSGNLETMKLQWGITRITIKGTKRPPLGNKKKKVSPSKNTKRAGVERPLGCLDRREPRFSGSWGQLKNAKTEGKTFGGYRKTVRKKGEGTKSTLEISSWSECRTQKKPQIEEIKNFRTKLRDKQRGVAKQFIRVRGFDRGGGVAQNRKRV